MIDEAEPWTCFHSKVVRARKPHRCDECGREIDRREPYETAAGFMDHSY